MEQKKIKKRFTLCYILLPLAAALISKLLYHAASFTGSDIYYTGASSPFMRAVPFICKYSYIVFDQMFTAAGISAVIYAVMYFGRKTAAKALACALGSFLIAETAGLVYNLIRNSLSAGKAVAALLAMLTEFLFCAAVFAASFIGASVFLKKRFSSRRRNREKMFSPIAAAVIPTAVSALLVILDLTFFNVIPFLLEYDNITVTETVNIVLDYVYYIGVNFVLAFLISCLILLLLRSVTGKLKPKKSGVLA